MFQVQPVTYWHLSVFFFYQFEVYHLNSYKNINSFLEVLNSNQLILKLNRFICNYRLILHVHGTCEERHHDFDIPSNLPKPSSIPGTSEGVNSLKPTTQQKFSTTSSKCATTSKECALHFMFILIFLLNKMHRQLSMFMGDPTIEGSRLFGTFSWLDEMICFCYFLLR